MNFYLFANFSSLRSYDLVSTSEVMISSIFT